MKSLKKKLPKPAQGFLTLEEVARRFGLDPSHQATYEISHFDRWVASNNPHPKLSYGKGWWDFVEIIRRLTEKLEITDISTVGTFVLRTPPPQEELISPIVKLTTPKFNAYLKQDFGEIWACWTVSIERSDSSHSSLLGTFLSDKPITERTREGFEDGWLFPPFGPHSTSFTSRLEDELDLYAVHHLLHKSSGEQLKG
jgi:hypothetical protein